MNACRTDMKTLVYKCRILDDKNIASVDLLNWGGGGRVYIERCIKPWWIIIISERCFLKEEND